MADSTTRSASHPIEKSTEKSTEKSNEEFDALVVGGNIAGLALAYWLGQYGYRTALIEKAPRLGGIDGSFRNRNGRVFDFGLHALDYMRSELTSKLFEHVVDGRAHRIQRRRGIVLRNHLIDYNAPLAEWPAELRELLPEGELVDELGAEPPTREGLARYYGQAFADLIYDEALPSYPADTRHLAFGVEPWQLLSAIYPWFFPRARRQSVAINKSRSYQDRVRERLGDQMLYPDEGGFGTFAMGFRRKLENVGVEICAGLPDLQFEMDGSTVECVSFSGRRLHAPRVYWCAGPAPLCRVLDMPAPPAPDRFVLGSFEFAQPISCDFTELLAADPSHAINRISFPGKLALDRDDRVQIEFSHPGDSDAYGETAEYWLETWLSSLRRLGIVGADNEVADFDLKPVTMLYNSFGVEGRPVSDVEVEFDVAAESNLRPVMPTLRKVNINTRIPMYLEYLAKDLAGTS